MTTRLLARYRLCHFRLRRIYRRFIASWFLVSKEAPTKAKMSDKERFAFISDLILAFVFGAVSMPVIYRWIGWLFCWCALIYILQNSIVPINGFPRRTRFSGLVILTIAFILIFRTTVISMWREEQASLIERDLIGAGQMSSDGQQRMVPEVQVGDTESSIIPEPGFEGPFFKPFPDAEFIVKYGRKGPLVSTTIRDSESHVVATIDNNHWKVFPPFCPDKNYTKTSLEILNDSFHVVFQLRIFPDRVHVQGEWWDNEGHGFRFSASPDHIHGLVSRLGPQVKKNEGLISPIFMYPSSLYWGEFVH